MQNLGNTKSIFCNFNFYFFLSLKLYCAAVQPPLCSPLRLKTPPPAYIQCLLLANSAAVNQRASTGTFPTLANIAAVKQRASTATFPTLANIEAVNQRAKKYGKKKRFICEILAARKFFCHGCHLINTSQQSSEVELCLLY